jgi:hypothetical protein
MITSELEVVVNINIVYLLLDILQLCFVMLNGETRPGVHPKPVVTARPFRLPTIDALPKGNVENDRVRTTLWESNECAHLGHIQQQHAEAIRREVS